MTLYREWFTRFYTMRYRKVWVHSKDILCSPSLSPLSCVYPYFWKCQWKLLAWHHWIMVFVPEIRRGMAGHAVWDTLPLSYLPCQASPPARPPRVLFLRTPMANFGLICRARDLSFGTQSLHIHSSGSDLLPTQPEPIPHSPLHHSPWRWRHSGLSSCFWVFSSPLCVHINWCIYNYQVIHPIKTRNLRLPLCEL